MTKSLIIDCKLVAQDAASIFENWSWPIAQSRYDDHLTRFIEWTDELHTEIGDSQPLLDAYFLSKASLLKDLSYVSAAWLDITVPGQGGFTPVFGQDKYLHRMVADNSYPRIVPAEIAQAPRSVGIRQTLRAVAARYRRKRSDHKTLGQASNPYFSVGPNQLTRQISPANIQRIRRTHADIIRDRSNRMVPGRVVDLAGLISTNFCAELASSADSISPEFVDYTRWLVERHLTFGWLDASATDSISKIPSNSRLFTGTGGSYAARLLAYQFGRAGHTVLRTTHGGDTPFFDDVLWPTIEFRFASTYVAFGELGAASLAAAIGKRSESGTPGFVRNVIAAGSKAHQAIRDSAAPVPDRPVRNVSVIAASFTGIYPVMPHMKLHDVVYLEWHRRLLSTIGNLGYLAVSKRHPKGVLTDDYLFGDVAHDEHIDSSMSAIQGATDAYVFDFPASAFMEALCTMKPVILIDMPVRRMLEPARTVLAKSVEFVSASFDERNRVVIDETELKDAIEAPVNIDEREQLIQDYLLRPSRDFDSIYD